MNKYPADIIKNAKILWDFMHLDHRIEKSDCILALGSHDTRVAERAAELYLQGYAPLLVFSGGLGRLTDMLWTEPEAVKFAKIAMDMGVPEEKILTESKSTNTGENIKFTKAMLSERGLAPQSIILIQKPYMQKRAYATFMKHWPEMKIISTSPQISFENYTNEEIPVELLINILVGDLQRMMIYPGKGFQIELPVPPEVIQAFELLKKEGFTEHLI